MEEFISAIFSALVGALAGATVTGLVSFFLARRKEIVEKRERAKMASNVVVMLTVCGSKCHVRRHSF